MKLLPNEPKQRNALLVGVLALIGLYAFHAYWYTPRKERIDEMQARLEQLEDQNRRAQIVATRGGKELEEKLALYERHLIRLEQLIPKSEEVPSLLNSMAVEARQNDVELALMRPEPSEVGVHYTKTSYQIGVLGEYHDVGRFLAAIASLPRIVTPVELDITGMELGAAEDEEEDETQVSAQFKIQTYVIPPPGASVPLESTDQVAQGGDE
jgi:type IV pilus assembly protein PilO